MIVFHSLRRLCVRSVDVMTSHLLFFSSIILSTSLVPASMVVLPNDCLNTVSCMLYRNSVIPPMDQGCTVLCILSVDAFCMSHALSHIMYILGDECVSLSIYALFRLDNFQEFSIKSVLVPE